MRVHTQRAVMEVIWIVGCMCFIVLPGCSGGTEIGNPTPTAVSSFNSNDELEGYIKDQLASNVVPRNVADLSAMEGDYQGGSYSSTNIQEAGVDESDVTKTDGTYLYIARRDEVTIVRAAPAADENVVSRIDVSGTVDSLYLYNNLLIIFTIPEGTFWTTRPEQRLIFGMPYWISTQAKTGVLIYDISNPSKPEKLKEVEIEGTLQSSRVVSGKLHVVQQFLPELPAFDVDYNGSSNDQASTIEKNAQSLDSLTLTDLIPSYTVIDEGGQRSTEQPLMTYHNFYRPSIPEGGSIITITTFQLDNATLPFESIGFVGDTHVVYASTSSLYLIANNYDCTTDTCSSHTVIHKFNLTNMSDISSGTVPGWIVNQFSLGEYENVLRIATTDYTKDFSSFTNNVFCLKATGGNLQVIGQIDDISSGEKIYSARFIGARGYLVTFVQVDPLITIDLSDPASPSIAGEIILPGYSTYIHPVDDTSIITLGMNTVEDAGFVLNNGVQLSLFDVSDIAHPDLVARVTIGDRGTDSEALWNHKAFTYFAQDHLIAFPVDLFEAAGNQDDPWTAGNYTFSGLYVYRLNVGEGFDYLGRISTPSAEDLFYSYWTRGIFIGDTVHAVNAGVVRSADVSDIEHTIHTLNLD